MGMAETTDDDWFHRQLKVAEDATRDWPDWMKREAGILITSDRVGMAPLAHACNETARNIVDLTKEMETLLPDCNEEQRAILENVIAELRRKAGEMVTV